MLNGLERELYPNEADADLGSEGMQAAVNIRWAQTPPNVYLNCFRVEI